MPSDLKATTPGRLDQTGRPVTGKKSGMATWIHDHWLQVRAPIGI